METITNSKLRIPQKQNRTKQTKQAKQTETKRLSQQN
jgi:hypothetical protein